MDIDGKHNKKLGKQGEDEAAKYLKKNGYKIVARNFKNPFGEIDIIAQKGEILAFVEVKTRLTDSFGQPSEAVNESRKRRYIMGAKYYFANREIDFTVRFDIIEVFKDEVNHIENAFGA